VVLISQDVGELQDMMEDLNIKSEKIGLTINLSKAKIMTKIENVHHGKHVIENCKEYVYLGHIIKLGKEN